jgi:hypothetical protein
MPEDKDQKKAEPSQQEKSKPSDVPMKDLLKDTTTPTHKKGASPGRTRMRK